MDEISRILGLPIFELSTGSTEPKEFLVQVADALGFQLLESDLHKHQISQLIIESAGISWLPGFYSVGGTITQQGFEALLQAVQFFHGEE
jgi:hypothetical protein